MQARFKLRALVMLVALVALGLAVVVVSIENRRLRKEIQAERFTRQVAIEDASFLLKLEEIRVTAAPITEPAHMPEGSDAFARDTKD
jgi:hypothetical protein